jgi:hypothetical protein
MHKGFMSRLCVSRYDVLLVSWKRNQFEERGQMRRDINHMATLIREGILYTEEETNRPLLPEDLPFSLTYRPANVHDIKFFVNSPAWAEMLSSGRVFFYR